MHILTLTSLFPNDQQPHHAVFVRSRMENYVRKYGHRWTVVAPVPFYPKLPFRTLARHDAIARVPRAEHRRGYSVHHPRYFVTPKMGMRHYGRWIAAGARRLVAKLHAENPFDIIDGHYVYPDGTAAVRLGAELGIPVILSARGTDLNLYPKLPAIARLIRSNLEGCRHLICVCEGLRQEALKLGVSPSRVSVIGNGVDAERFRRGDQAEARRLLGIPERAKVILSVGHLTERKGFHLLIEAFARLGRVDADIHLIIVGDGSERASLGRLAEATGIGNKVRFAGAADNADLPGWYRAADLFALASSREGWPNVLCEAQACGLPAVATAVWGIPEIIRCESLGILVQHRTVEALHAGLEAALKRPWDREYIEGIGRERTWERVAAELEPIFSGSIGLDIQQSRLLTGYATGL